MFGMVDRNQYNHELTEYVEEVLVPYYTTTLKLNQPVTISSTSPADVDGVLNALLAVSPADVSVLCGISTGK